MEVVCGVCIRGDAASVGVHPEDLLLSPDATAEELLWWYPSNQQQSYNINRQQEGGNSIDESNRDHPPPDPPGVVTNPTITTLTTTASTAIIDNCSSDNNTAPTKHLEDTHVTCRDIVLYKGTSSVGCRDKTPQVETTETAVVVGQKEKEGQLQLYQQASLLSSYFGDWFQTVVASLQPHLLIQSRDDDGQQWPTAMLATLDDLLEWFKGDEPPDVLVQVEAVAMTDNEASSPFPTDDLLASHPFMTKNFFVGTVDRAKASAKRDAGITSGMKVVSIVKWLSLSRHLCIQAKNLLPVPYNLDASDVACIVSAYLPAYQAINHGKRRPYRYDKNSLKGIRVLIMAATAVKDEETGEEKTLMTATAEAQAAVRLAAWAGASVFVVAPPEHAAAYAPRSIVIGSDKVGTDLWVVSIKGRMDLVIDYGFPKDFHMVRDALSPKGRLVCCPQRKHSDVLSFLEQCQLSMIERATIYDYEGGVDGNSQDAKEDLKFLFGLLSSRKIRPAVDRFITLNEVRKTLNEMRMNVPVVGTIVCEPWKESRE